MSTPIPELAKNVAYACEGCTCSTCLEQVADIIGEALMAAEKRGEQAADERAAKIAETEGVYPELNVFAGGPEWYRHGKRIASAIRDRSKT